jgi:hypothetical protein
VRLHLDAEGEERGAARVKARVVKVTRRVVEETEPDERVGGGERAPPLMKLGEGVLAAALVGHKEIPS